MGIDRDRAARISFLMLVPVTAGAVRGQGLPAIVDGLPDDVAGPMIAGIIASAISGYLAIAGLLKFVAHPQLRRLRRLPGARRASACCC